MFSVPLSRPVCEAWLFLANTLLGVRFLEANAAVLIQMG